MRHHELQRSFSWLLFGKHMFVQWGLHRRAVWNKYETYSMGFGHIMLVLMTAERKQPLVIFDSISSLLLLCPIQFLLCILKFITCSRFVLLWLCSIMLETCGANDACGGVGQCVNGACTCPDNYYGPTCTSRMLSLLPSSFSSCSCSSCSCSSYSPFW